jgi:hypothetical protein
MRYIAVLSLVLIASCSAEYKKDSGRVLCDPKTGEAYYIQHSLGSNSVVLPNKNLEDLCKKN